MPTYVALLRAINVGGRTYKMADLRTCLTASGLKDVETYIQTGNIRFRSSMRSRARVEQHVEKALAGGCGFDVPALVLTPGEIRKVYDDAMALDPPLPGEPRRYVTFLKADPPAQAVEEIDAWNIDGERAQVVGRAVHVWLDKPTHEARFSNARFERSLGTATTRDLKVVRVLAERWGSG
ncbi:MAG: DUF1697 domain-containing protein [Actinomycetota bacterium]|nr:DUF1697 domain-containing protein [Actinomycetota bacterium]